MNNSIIIIAIIVVTALFLIWTQHSQPKIVPQNQSSNLSKIAPFIGSNKNTHPEQCQSCEYYKKQLENINPSPSTISLVADSDPYSDPIKKQDLHSIYDPLTYPQMRLPRSVLEKYNEYYQKNGEYPPFNQQTKPFHDNPVINGYLIKEQDDSEPFPENTPSAIPLFRLQSMKSTNRFFYYIIDQRYQSKIELKIPLNNVKINGRKYTNADYYGLPELSEGDIIEQIAIYPNSKFKVGLYNQYSFP